MWMGCRSASGPLIGFNCTTDPIANPDGVCRPCENKPPQADFVDSTNQLSRVKCDFECKANYHGHPEYSGICVKCGVLQENYANVGLPSNAIWVENPQVCSDDAWSCNSGYTRANSTRYCCPDVIPNSHPHPSYHSEPRGLEVDQSSVGSMKGLRLPSIMAAAMRSPVCSMSPL